MKFKVIDNNENIEEQIKNSIDNSQNSSDNEYSSKKKNNLKPVNNKYSPINSIQTESSIIISSSNRKTKSVIKCLNKPNNNNYINKDKYKINSTIKFINELKENEDRFTFN